MRGLCAQAAAKAAALAEVMAQEAESAHMDGTLTRTTTGTGTATHSGSVLRSALRCAELSGTGPGLNPLRTQAPHGSNSRLTRHVAVSSWLVCVCSFWLR